MAGWVKSLQCKSRAADDVIHGHSSSSSSCRKSFKSLNDVIDPKEKPRKHQTKKPVSRKPESSSPKCPMTRVRTNNGLSDSRRHPALTELPEGHPSRNVVEIIFHTSWSPKAFSGRIEMVFKVQNSARTVTRFEEYREVVKSESGNDGSGIHELQEDNSRCVADGNEVMRFHCLGPTSGGEWAFQWGKAAAMCTFSGSRVAHESAGGGRGRKAMLICRVIAGRVGKQLKFDSLYNDRLGYDSMSGENGELLVFDSHAVLPCFLVIYKL